MTEEIQLDARHLHEMARNPENPPPRVFIDANEAIEQTERAYREAVWHRHDLIREARQLGVSWVALARWTGMNVRTLHEIVADR